MNYFIIECDFPVDWLSYQDVEKLIPLIRSDKKCLCSVSIFSSYLPSNDHASVGGYAIMFINAFRKKEQVQMGLWKCPVFSEEEAAGIEVWWKENNKK